MDCQIRSSINNDGEVLNFSVVLRQNKNKIAEINKATLLILVILFLPYLLTLFKIPPQYKGVFLRKNGIFCFFFNAFKRRARR